MKALTLYQPWATLVAIGAKRIETRSWGTNYWGPLAIHAAKSFPPLARLYTHDPTFVAALEGAGIENIEQLPLGCVVATCKLVKCWKILNEHHNENTEGGIHLWSLDKFNDTFEPYSHLWKLDEKELSFGDHGIGRFQWFLMDVKVLPEPIPARGRQGLWEWDEKGLLDADQGIPE